MSCDSLSQNFTVLNVSMGSLPEGFCPSTMQELANAIATRLIVTPNQAFSTFAIGSVEPTSNVGPWLKNCEEWFVFDDATGRYIPILKGGFDSQQYYAASNTFVVPDFIYKLRIHAWGAGGGGSNTDGAGTTGSGGGGGAYGMSIITVVPGQSINFTIGGGGVVSTVGGDTTILTGVAGGGKAGVSPGVSGLGGAATGFDINFSGGSGMANSGLSTTAPCLSGGDAGGWGGKGGTVTQLAVVAGRIGGTPGGGGSGGSNSALSAGGAGANGGILIEY